MEQFKADFQDEAEEGDIMEEGGSVPRSRMRTGELKIVRPKPYVLKKKSSKELWPYVLRSMNIVMTHLKNDPEVRRLIYGLPFFVSILGIVANRIGDASNACYGISDR